MKENIFKAAFAAAIASLCSYFDVLIIPIIVLLAVMIADYVSGMIKAYMTSTLSSKRGVRGIIKKVSYLLVACVGFCVDWIISEALTSLGVSFALPAIFGTIVVVWLIINELISILENLSVVGVPMPKFLIKIVNKLKITVENTSGTEEESEDSNEQNL